jgi:hypothetical protein
VEQAGFCLPSTTSAAFQKESAPEAQKAIMRFSYFLSNGKRLKNQVPIRSRRRYRVIMRFA